MNNNTFTFIDRSISSVFFTMHNSRDCLSYKHKSFGQFHSFVKNSNLQIYRMIEYIYRWMLFNCSSWYWQVRVSFFFFILHSSYLLLISSFSSRSSLSLQSIDTCIQTRRASAILLVKLDLCWTHMVQYTFEMMGSHLFPFSSYFSFF